MYLYQQIAEQIHALIKESAVNTKLPDERSLAEQFSVSRSTIRKAIFELKDRGLLTVTQGAGIYVSNGEMVQNLDSGFYSLTEDMKSIGKSIETKILSVEWVAAKKVFKEPLFDVAKVLKIRRIRIINGKNGIYEVNYLDGRKMPGIEAQLRDNESIYSLIREQYGIYFEEGHELLSFVMSNSEAEEALALSEKTPFAHVERVVRVKGKVLEKSVSYILPELFTWKYALKGKKPLRG